MSINGVASTNSIKKAIRKTDAKKSIMKNIERKFPSNHNFIDAEARNAFKSKKSYVFNDSMCAQFQPLWNEGCTCK